MMPPTVGPTVRVSAPSVCPIPAHCRQNDHARLYAATVDGAAHGRDAAVVDEHHHLTDASIVVVCEGSNASADRGEGDGVAE